MRGIMDNSHRLYLVPLGPVQSPLLLLVRRGLVGMDMRRRRMLFLRLLHLVRRVMVDSILLCRRHQEHNNKKPGSRLV